MGAVGVGLDDRAWGDAVPIAQNLPGYCEESVDCRGRRCMGDRCRLVGNVVITQEGEASELETVTAAIAPFVARLLS